MRTGIPLCLFLVAACIAAQPVVSSPDSTGVVAGTVVDALSGEPLRGDVTVKNTVFGSGIDSAGRFSILLATGKYQLGACAMFHVEASESATVSAACTTRVDFRLLPQKYVNDSIMASLARIRISELARHPQEPAVNNSIRIAAWRTFLSGKGTCGLKSRSFGVEGQPSYTYLVIENGSARIVTDDREGGFWFGGNVSERRYSHLQLIEDRRWDPDSSRYSMVPFSGAVPRGRELRFVLSNQTYDKDPTLF